MNRKRMLLAACLISAASWASAQVRVTGTVVSAEDGQPVVGASVIVPGTKVGTVTDINGHYTLQVPEGHKNIRVSSIGMEAQTLQAKDNARVVLQGNANALDEVVVTGYGNFKKSSFTGAAASMSTDKLNDVPSVSIEDKLSGNIPGVSMSTSSGQPGAVNNIVIRGMGSINAGNNPLIVIDGTPVQSGNVSGFNDPATGSGYNSAGTNILSTLNSNDIASMTVIKDAAAASLYGSRAANGVIVITTKSGKSGKTKVDFRSDWGFSNMAINYRPTLSGDDRRALIYQGLKNKVYDGKQKFDDGQAYTDEAHAKEYADATIDKYASKPNSGWADWRDALFHNGSHQNYQASISGGNANTQFYASMAYTKQNGIVDDSGLERMTGNANITHRFGNFKLDVTSLFSKLHQSSNMEGTSFASPIMNAVWIMTPSNPIYAEDGSLNTTKGLNPLNNGLNPLYEYEHQSDLTNLTRAYNTVALEWNIWDGLKLREKIAYDYTNSVEDVLWDQYSNNGKAASGNMQRNTNEYSILNTQTQLSYVKTFGQHNIDALLGFETEDWRQNMNFQSGNGYYGALYEFINATTTSTQSWKYQSRMTSFLGRVNYNYNNIYYLGVSYRRDGSSRMARENRWGNFWSVSGAWRFGGESFMEPVKDVVTDGKLRVSYGVNGTLPSKLYSYINQFSSGEFYNGMNGMGIVGVENKNLKWEQNKAWNIGLDLTFWNRLSLTADYYIRKTSDLIMDRPISYVPGYFDPTTYSAIKPENVGSLKNSGIEITLQSTNIQTKDFLWSTTFNIAHNKNKITALSGQNEIISGPLIHRIGQPYYSYYLYEYAGVDPQTGLESYYINDGSENSRKTTTKVNEANKVLIGKHDAAVEGGLTNFMKWKFIDFNFTLTYKLGGDSFDYATWLHDNGGQYTLYGNIPSYYKLSDMWQKPGDNAKLPKFQAGYGTRILSSRWLMPNDYLRVKNLTLGFSIPQNYISKLGMSKARVYFSANNLLTWKSSNLFVDPETPIDGLATFETPAMRTYTFGVELSF